MKRCDHCGGRFGLIRYRHYTSRFCSARCLEHWMQSRLEQVRRMHFLEWLDQKDDPCTRST
jgi:hypothetical protein